jgi:4-hydroxy-3-polyprenylbenzoate decarboxylase
MTRRLVIAMSGASGIVYGVRLLELLAEAGVETHLVASKAALITLAHETRLKWAEVKRKAHVVHDNDDVTATIASGSFRTLGMIVAPCSMKTLGEIASGAAQTLIARAADVTLKERRRLTLVPRETPLHLGHLRNMAAVTEMGGVIAPPVPAFYAKPTSLEDMVDHTVGRLLDLYDIDVGVVRRWGE